MFKYGCWITPEGEILDVDNSMAHIHVLRRATHSDMTYSLAFDAGWVRVVWRNGDTDFTAQCRYPTIKAREMLRNLVKDFFRCDGMDFYLDSRQIPIAEGFARDHRSARQLVHRLITLEEELADSESTV